MGEAQRNWRDGPIYWGLIAFCISATVFLLTLEWLATDDITARVTHIKGKQIDLRSVGVWVPRCGKDHFWGKMISYRDDDTGIPGEIYLHSGRACWDWTTRSWVTTGDVGFFWFKGAPEPKHD